MFGLFVKRHAEAAALYNKVSVVYAHAADGLEKKYETCLSNENNVLEIRIYFRKTKNKLISILRYFKALRIGYKLAGHTDIVHVNILTRAGVFALWQKIIHNTPYLITEHWSRYLPGNDFGGFMRKQASRIVAKHASMVSVVTENLSAAMRNHGLKNRNYRIIPNVVDTNFFRPVTKGKGMARFVHVSCFENKSKNISGLLHGIKLLSDKGIDFECTLIGDGEDWKEMKDLCDSLALGAKVRFTGLLEGEDLVAEVARNDFMVVSSNYENLPVVIIEAMSCGLPIVSTNVGGISEVVDSDCGILVEPRDVTALANGIEKMIDEHERYDSKVIRNKVVERNSIEAVGQLLTKWYSETLSNGNRL